MFKFNNNKKPQNALGNILKMRYSFNSGQSNSYSRDESIDQGKFKNNKGRGVGYNGIEFMNHQNYLEQLIKYQKAQLQQQQQQLLLTQQQYEYNLQLQHQYRLQCQLNQNHLNVHHNPVVNIQQTNMFRMLPPVKWDSQIYGKSDHVCSGVYYLNNQEEFQVLEPYEIIIIPKCDNTVTVRDVSHVDVSKNKSSKFKEMEVEVEIKKGDKNIELENVRDEFLSEKKIGINYDKNQEIEVNVYETKSYNGEIYFENEINQVFDDLSFESLNNRNIEVDLNECYNHEIQDEQILGTESELEEVCFCDNQGEIEIEEDSVLVIKYKNDHVETDILDLMERNIDNCVIDGNPYYYENFVRSFSYNDYSFYGSQIGPSLAEFGGNYTHLANNDFLLQGNDNSKLIEISKDENEEQEQDESQGEKTKGEQKIEEIQEKDMRNIDTNSESKSPSNNKRSLEELNEKTQRFNLLLEKINRMEQMNISFKEAFINEKWNLSFNLTNKSNSLDDDEAKQDEDQSEYDKSVSEYSVLDTVKDIYDSNSHIVYKDVKNGICESSSERLDEIENELEQGEEQIQRYIQAINDYFANEGLLSVCESRLNTHRWERNYENAMCSLNNQLKDSSCSSNITSESDPGSIADFEVNSRFNMNKDKTKEDLVISELKDVTNLEEHKDSLILSDEMTEEYNNKLVKYSPQEECQKHDSNEIKVKDTKNLKQNLKENSQSIIVESPEAHLFPVSPNHKKSEMASPNSTSGTVLVSNKTNNNVPSSSIKSDQKVKIPMINIPNSNDTSRKMSPSNILKKSQNVFKKSNTFLHAGSTQKNNSLMGSDPNKELKRDDEILARLSQCRVVNSKIIKLATNNNGSLNDNNGDNINKNCKNTTNIRPRMNTCSVTFPSSNYSQSIYNNFNQYTNKLAHEKMTRGPVYNNSFGGKCVNTQVKPHVPIQIKKEPNLGFRSLLSNGIKVNMTELMKPKVIRR